MLQTPGHLRQGRYVVRGLLGEGAQGATFEALDAQSGRLVAIKRFDVGHARSWKDVELAEREARVLATLDHPFLPHYVEHFEEDGVLYLVMEKIEGETLETIRRRHGALPEPEVARFLACADSAFTYLHGRSAPVIHRDVKPRNVIRRPDGSYVFVDFGAVSERMRPNGGSTFVGTYGYMAPEQLQGRAFPSTDVYAVATTAVAALAGSEPDTLPHRGLRVDARAALQGRVSPGLVHALEQMLEPDPEKRPSRIVTTLASGAPAAALDLAGSPDADDVAAKSIRKLLWALWGIGWVLVPVIIEATGKNEDFIAPIMFGWLALNLVLGWHKAAAIRMVLRAFREEGRGAQRGSTERFRVAPAPLPMRVDAPAQARVQVNGYDAEHVRPFGDTEVSRVEPMRAQQPR
jgi:hypothetical protein